MNVNDINKDILSMSLLILTIFSRVQERCRCVKATLPPLVCGMVIVNNIHLIKPPPSSSVQPSPLGLSIALKCIHCTAVMFCGTCGWPSTERSPGKPLNSRLLCPVLSVSESPTYFIIVMCHSRIGSFEQFLGKNCHIYSVSWLLNIHWQLFWVWSVIHCGLLLTQFALLFVPALLLLTQRSLTQALTHSWGKYYRIQVCWSFF